VIHPSAASGRSEPPVHAEPVIPLVHAPDDPGPEAAAESESPGVQDGGWRKIFQ
jgi:hypothetical protein